MIEQTPDDMEITDYELYLVPPRWVFLKLVTEDGTEGWGEPIIENHAQTTMSAVREILDNYLVGQDATEIERHWQAMYRARHVRGGPILMSAIAGIDQALWDIKGKQYDAPVYELLGGRARDRIPVYQWVGGDTPEEVAAAAQIAVDHGYRALKMAAVSSLRRLDSPSTIMEAKRRVGAVRDVIGEDIDLGVDFRGRVSKAMVRWLAAELDEYGAMFYEEPVLPDNIELLSEVRPHTRTPLASGERLYSRWDFEEILSEGLVDVIQPNPSHAGGISEVRKIAAHAETQDVALVPHCPVGPIALAACVQLDTVIPNAILQAQYHEIHAPENNEHLAYLKDQDVFQYSDGFIRPPDAPGLGIEIDEEYVTNRQEPTLDWENPVWYHNDGSVAEW
ncbi:galactonate dehydratase [Halohasta litchfieldiae]|jgi:galactonate dehydratase|nr:galactonate dehydratase [Halohasta litchfieldiae]